MTAAPAEILRELAPTGVLRVAVNFGNPVLAHRDSDGTPGGISVDLAREIADRLGVAVRHVPFESAGAVCAALPGGGIDLMFLAIDPVRARDALFTAPYVVIEGSYLVRQASPYRSVADLDRAGVEIAVGDGAAYDLFLRRTLRHATLRRYPSSAAAIACFERDDLDAAAGIRQALVAHQAADRAVRVIEDSFTTIRQAAATPAGRPVARAWLHRTIEELKARGWIAARLAAHGQADAQVAPACERWPEF